jgi:hypothetical protein
MRYEEFRQAFMLALRESKLGLIGLWPTETIDLRSTDRKLEVHVEPIGGSDAEPFFVAATISWTWRALDTARSATKEEDMLTELFGRDEAAEILADQPWLRVDIEFRGSLPWGKPLPMPASTAWAAWTREVVGRLERTEPLTPEDHVVPNATGALEVLAWQGPPKAEIACNPTAALELEAVTIAAMQLIELPRTLDVGVEPDDGPEPQLRAMFQRIRAALMAWMQALDHLNK